MMGGETAVALLPIAPRLQKKILAALSFAALRLTNSHQFALQTPTQAQILATHTKENIPQVVGYFLWCGIKAEVRTRLVVSS
jgi:hypothetical protein